MRSRSSGSNRKFRLFSTSETARRGPPRPPHRFGQPPGAERRWPEIPKREGSLCLLLYDIEGFREINSRHGSQFGDKLLLALAHSLRAKFPEEGSLFRWGADEFLVMAEGSLASCVKHSRYICDTFAAGKYCAAESGSQAPLRADRACGGAQYVRGETLEELYRRSRENLEQSRGGAP
jgi:diguanylate cyclase (GGDEF)-like protein